MDYATVFVNEFVNQTAIMERRRWNMIASYAFDQRPGTIEEKFTRDANDYGEYVKMFRP
jgi:hypothetical protein